MMSNMGSGNYFYPIKREFLNLSGGTVTGNTLFTSNLSASTFYSGSTNLGDLINTVVTGSTKIVAGINTFTGGTLLATSVNITGASLNNLYTSGETVFLTVSSSTLSANSVFIESQIQPIIDNTSDIGAPLKRFRNLNIVNGVSVNFTATTQIYTPSIQLGSVELTEYSVVRTGDTINSGDW